MRLKLRISYLYDRSYFKVNVFYKIVLYAVIGLLLLFLMKRSKSFLNFSAYSYFSFYCLFQCLNSLGSCLFSGTASWSSSSNARWQMVNVYACWCCGHFTEPRWYVDVIYLISCTLSLFVWNIHIYIYV